MDPKFYRLMQQIHWLKSKYNISLNWTEHKLSIEI